MKKLLAIVCLGFTIISINAQPVTTNKIENALSAVVTVAVEKTQPIGKVLMGFRGEVAEEAYEQSLSLADALGSGSGFVVKRNNKLYVVTNAHVVESASDERGSVFIYSYSRKKYEMKVKGGDSFFDVAVLEFVDQPGAEVTFMDFAKTMPYIAQKVYAIGNPLGEYPYTVTDGIISAQNRVRGGLTGKYGYLQTTATIIWGNSGGPLINENAEVVGINSQIGFAQGPDGNTYLQQQLNFSLEPILSNRIVNEIIEKGKVVRSYVGIELEQGYEILNTEAGPSIGGPIDSRPVLSGFIPGTDAEKKLRSYAGYKLNMVNNVEVRNIEEALGEFEKTKPGSMVSLSLASGSQVQTVEIKADTLNKQRLENIAVYMISKMPNVSVDNSSAQLKLILPYETNSSSIRWRAQGAENPGKPQSSGASFYMLAAGIASESENDIWRITTLSDLGALLKIYGLRGGIEYYLSEKPGDASSVKNLTQHFSEKENVFKTKLWY